MRKEQAGWEAVNFLLLIIFLGCTDTLKYNKKVGEWLTKANQNRKYRFLRQSLPQLSIVLQVLGTEKTDKRELAAQHLSSSVFCKASIK